MQKLISIEGNIGAGKSTIVRLIKQCLKNEKLKFLEEPVEKWLKTKNEMGENILDLFYKDKKRWSYSFQMNAFISKQKLIEKCLEDSNIETIITERSVYTDRECFAKQLFEEGNIDKLEWELYDNWYNWLIEKVPIKLSGIIYLRCSPEISNERIKKRLRQEESSIPIEYLQDIHKKHEKWLFSTNIPVLIIDVNHDFENCEMKKKIIINNIKEFINK